MKVGHGRDDLDSFAQAEIGGDGKPAGWIEAEVGSKTPSRCCCEPASLAIRRPRNPRPATARMMPSSSVTKASIGEFGRSGFTAQGVASLTI